MHKDDPVYVGHMLDTARKVIEKTRGVDRQQYLSLAYLRLGGGAAAGMAAAIALR